MHEHDVPATILVEHLDEPLVESTHLQDHQEATGRSAPPTDIGEEFTDLVPPSTHLPPNKYVTFLVAEIHGQLLAMLVDR
jgi:hypothetical protein